MKISYIKCDPGGNITALVKTKVRKEDIARISKIILEEEKEIEQVGFISQPLKNKEIDGRIDMMGGEFCANASRSLIWLLYNNKKGINRENYTSIKIESSGTSKIIESKVYKDELIEMDIPIREMENSVTEIKIENQIPAKLVEMDGISHIVLKKEKRNFEKKEVKNIINSLSLDKEAIGFISYLKKSENDYEIFPFVWVKGTNTLIEETSCASGSMALAQVLAKENKSDVIINILQPSGKSLEVEVQFKNNKFIKGKIKGKVSIIKEVEREIKW